MTQTNSQTNSQKNPRISALLQTLRCEFECTAIPTQHEKDPALRNQLRRATLGAVLTRARLVAEALEVNHIDSAPYRIIGTTPEIFARLEAFSRAAHPDPHEAEQLRRAQDHHRRMTQVEAGAGAGTDPVARALEPYAAMLASEAARQRRYGFGA